MNTDSELTSNPATISAYIDVLKDLFVIEDMPAWNPNLRSKEAIRTSDNRYFIDPSIATAALNSSPQDLINDLNTFGFLFETLCVRDLRVYAEFLRGSLYHFRSKGGLECDAVIHLPDGRYGLIEIKLGGETLINDGIQNLNKLNELIEKSSIRRPAFSMVLTGTEKYAYHRSDGIYICPISALRD